MSGYSVEPTEQSKAIALLACAYWDSLSFDHATHYLELSLPEATIAIFEKASLADMKDEHVDRCAAQKDRLLVLVITGHEGDKVTFMVLSLPREPGTRCGGGGDT